MNTAHDTAGIGHNNPPKPFAEMSRDEQLLAWDATKKQLDVLKEQEMAMRKHIVEGAQQGIDPERVGTQNVELGNGWKLKAVIADAYVLDTDNDKVDAVLDQLEDWQADRLVKWTGTLSKREYDQLDPEDRAKVDTVLTIKRKAPTLTLVPPKGA